MIYYKRNNIQENVSVANLTETGEIKLSEMGMLPFIAPYYKGDIIPRNSSTMCEEFEGDCMKFVDKHLKIKWIKATCSNESSCNNTIYQGHVCTPEEITSYHYNTGRLYICPPADKITFYNNFEYYPATVLGLVLSPNYDGIKNITEIRKQINNFQIAREEMVSMADMSIVGSNPIIKRTQWVGRYQMKAGETQHTDT
jgi:hypothetical protein